MTLPSRRLRRTCRRLSRAAGLVLLVSGAAATGPAGGDEAVTVFAAASLSSAMQEILPAGGAPPARLSFAGSAALARQIEAGAPADLFLSANQRWMDHLQARGRIDSATRVDLLGNRLVVVSPAAEPFPVEVRAGFDFAGAFDGRLALGDPAYVPAGHYAQQALQALGWWPALRDRLAPAADVRAALVLVARGECPAGVVYATDATVTDRVRVLATLPDSLHAPIRYPAAVVSGRGRPAVRRVLARLRTPEATAVFRRHGFTVLDAGPAGP